MEKRMGNISNYIDKSAISVEGSADSSIIGPAFPSLLEFLLSKMNSLKNYNLDLAILEFAAGKILASEGVIFLEGTNEYWEAKAWQGKKISAINGKAFATASDFNERIRAGIYSVSDLHDLSNEESNDLFHELSKMGINSILSAPVGEYGILLIVSSVKTAFSKFDETTLRSIASQAGYLLTEEFKNKQMRKVSRESRRMLALCEKMMRADSLAELYDVTLRELHKAIKSDTASLMIVDALSGMLKIKAVYGLSKSAAQYSVNVGDGIAGWVADHKKALITKDVPFELFHNKSSRPNTYISLTVPIMAADTIIGVVNLGSRSKDFTFSQEDIAIVSRVMNYFAMALKNRGAKAGNDDYNDDISKALVDVIEANNPYMSGHGRKVAGYAAALAKKKGLTTVEISELKLAAAIHDIGYANIPSGIFTRNEPLTSVERMLIRDHPNLAGDILAEYPKLSNLAKNIRYHHENYDGSGYAAGLKGKDIPIGSRIIAVADAFDAMTSKRAYRQPFSTKEALNILNNQSGRQFDPELVTLFNSVISEQQIL